MKFWSTLRREAAELIDFCFPPHCLLCGEGLGGGDPTELCPDCLSGFLPLPSPHCPCCALPFETIGGRNHLCGDCLLHPPPYDWTLALGLYEETLRHAIHRFKFDGVINLDRPLARQLQRLWSESPPPWQPDLLVPVPLYRERLQMRTYNQAQLLARELGRLQGLPVEDRLLRIRDTHPQPGLTARERQENLAAAFTCGGGVAGKRVLLVDDVMTTAATARACAAALKAGGAGRVAIAVLARARRNPPLRAVSAAGSGSLVAE